MFSDPLAALRHSGTTAEVDNQSRISFAPSRFKSSTTDEERETTITHSKSPIKGTSDTNTRTNVTYVLRKKVPAVTTGGCCIPGYINNINTQFSIVYKTGTPLTDVQDAVKSLALWLAETSDATVLDKLYNGEA